MRERERREESGFGQIACDRDRVEDVGFGREFEARAEFDVEPEQAPATLLLPGLFQFLGGLLDIGAGAAQGVEGKRPALRESDLAELEKRIAEESQLVGDPSFRGFFGFHVHGPVLFTNRASTHPQNVFFSRFEKNVVGNAFWK